MMWIYPSSHGTLLPLVRVRGRRPRRGGWRGSGGTIRGRHAEVTYQSRTTASSTSSRWPLRAALDRAPPPSGGARSSPRQRSAGHLAQVHTYQRRAEPAAESLVCTPAPPRPPLRQFAHVCGSPSERARERWMRVVDLHGVQRRPRTTTIQPASRANPTRRGSARLRSKPPAP